MEIYVNGKKETLTQKNFVAKGGEGSIYKKGQVAYKIYEDLRNMIPLAKITELSVLDKPNIVKPKYPIYNKDKHILGFTMDWIGDNNVALVKVFTNKFREDNSINNDQVIELVENIKKDTQYIHQNKCLIVDGNELNYMVGKDFVTPYFIDVNSWKTPSFEATAIMSSIRDWRAKEFSEITDWFSFAVISFQLFVGIHPFKGKHPKYKKNDFKARITDCISVMNPEVSLPHSVRDFNLIPSSYKDWYFKTFEHGNRIPPPALPGTTGNLQVIVKLVNSTDNFEIESLKELQEKIVFHNTQLGITKTQGHIYLNNTDYKVNDNVEVVFTPLEQIPIFVKIEDGKAKFKPISHDIKEVDISASDVMIVNNVLFLKYQDKLMEMDFKYLGNKVNPFIKTSWNIERNSSQLFSNVIYQSALGKAVLSIPLASYTKTQFITKRIPELDDYQILDAKYDNKVCVLNTIQNGVYSRFIVIFDDKHDKYRIRLINDVDYAPINFITLDNGIAILITDDDIIEIFANRIDKPDVKAIKDPSVNSSMRLCKNGTQVRFFRDNKLYKIKMK